MSKKTILLLGDICTDWGFREITKEINAANVFNNINPLLVSADLVLANLESPLTSNEKKLEKNSVCLKGKTSDAKVLSDAGIKGVALANNHILDYEVSGYKDTIKALDECDITHYGTGLKDDKNAPAYFEIGDVKIGVLAFAEHEYNCAEDYGEGAYYWDDLESPQIITNAKKECDYLIVQYHGGIEHYIYPSPYLQKKCRVMADSGADFITCQHSHCVGTRENWNGSEILYGQGNAIFGYRDGNDKWNRGLIAKISIDESFKVDYIPINATPEGEMLANDIVAREILDDLRTESEKIIDGEFIKNNWRNFCDKQADKYLPMTYGRGRVFNKLNRLTHGFLIRVFTNKNSRMNAMNLIRCDAHRDVLKTIFEDDYKTN